MAEAPTCSIDIFSDAEILEPYRTYTAIRDLGPVVHLPEYEMYAMGRHRDVRKAAIDYRTFSSASGVAANPLVNAMSGAGEASATIASDPPRHTLLRRIVGAPLQPSAVAELEHAIQASADELVERLVAIDNPHQWELLQGDPSLMSNAIEECVRIESPIRGFTRLTTGPVEVDGTALPSGARVLLLYASANRDERRWDQPERFDIARDTDGHMGFGAGRHACAGMHLAKLEITCLMRAMLRRVKSFEAGAPVRAVNNLLRGLESLPVTITSRI